MKAISPMIAIVLLIAFTVAIGGLISLFLTGFTTTQTGLIETTAINQTKCAGVYINIDKVTSDTILFSNPTSQAITGINFTTSDGTNLAANANLAVGSISNYTFTRGANTSVKAFGLCLGSIVVQGICTSGQTCWQ